LYAISFTTKAAFSANSAGYQIAKVAR